MAPAPLTAFLYEIRVNGRNIIVGNDGAHYDADEMRRLADADASVAKMLEVMTQRPNLPSIG